MTNRLSTNRSLDSKVADWLSQKVGLLIAAPIWTCQSSLLSAKKIDVRVRGDIANESPYSLLDNNVQRRNSRRL
jgi:hypothetical protein